MNKPSDYDGRGYDPPYPTADDELDSLSAKVEGLTADLATLRARLRRVQKRQRELRLLPTESRYWVHTPDREAAIAAGWKALGET